METKKQTAVEWLALYIKGITTLNCDEVIVKAKEMEKEQMIKFANDFLFHDDTDLTAEQYYNETYGN